MTILTLNAGSSSLKFAVFDRKGGRTASGTVEEVGAAARLSVRGPDGSGEQGVDAPDHAAALAVALAALEAAGAVRGTASVAAVGHRIVHGGSDRKGPAVLDAPTVAALEALIPLAPLHQPHALAAVREAERRFPGAVQVGAFDTAFHQGKPWIHDAYAIPRAFHAAGVRRYGFHGLSYASVAGRLAWEAPDLAMGRVVVAHLGNGASVCAMEGGRSVACSMGFSAAEGLVMGTRAGRIDPGVLLWLMRERDMDADAIERLIYRESGLLALSEVSHDMRAILAAETGAAREAVDFYVERIAEEVARMAVALRGIDALVFCGGVGENAAPVRDAVIARLGVLSFSRPGGPVIRVVETDEEAVIADAAIETLRGINGNSAGQ